MKKKSASYGSWQSPITSEQVAKGNLKFSEIHIDGKTVFWLERNPADAGRTTIKYWSEEENEKELLPREYNVRTKVHEYGGGAFLFDKSNIYFVNDKDQQIYSLSSAKGVKKITQSENARFADGCIHPDKRSLFYVMELHAQKVYNSIVQIDLNTGEIKTILSGYDFYSSPRISPDGKQLAYVCWNHPNMPWDATELWMLDFRTNQKQKITGGNSESIVDPQWSQEGQLYYNSDRSGWWNIYSQGKSLWDVRSEFALPHWVFARSLMGFSNDGVFCSFVTNGSHGFATIPFKGKPQLLDLPFTDVDYVSVDGNYAALIASSISQPCSIVLYDIKNKTIQTIKHCCPDIVANAYLSMPISLDYPSNGRIAHAFYYPPKNPLFCGLPNEKPPLIVNVHGGPTGHISPSYNSEILFWSSRGFAYLDVNYGGSTGYGREYRNALKGKWGIIDIDDCTSGALYCASQGLADINRLTITGASAGGFTVLAALACGDVFKVGADYFGVSDLEKLALDTHKFESRYLDGLVAPYPEQKDIYLKRSPIYNIEKINSPVIIFQGDKDVVVPPSQSEMMFQSLSLRNIPTAYHLFEGESHGFRKAESIQRSFDEQLFFFSKILMKK